MADDNQQPEGGRRFRLTRRVKQEVPAPAVTPDPLTREEREMQDLANLGDDADRGTPEQDASLRRGCMSMVRVVMLFFVIMVGSIVATWCIKR